MQLRTMFTVLATVAMLAVSSTAQTTSGTVSSDETWSGTVTLTGDVVITGATVTVQPGTEIKFATTNDNIVNGTAERINIVVALEGALVAEGSEVAPITFTTTSLFPDMGAWGRIDVMGLSDGNATVFRYCNFLYGQTPVELRNPDGSSAVTVLTVDHCYFYNSGAASIYATSGCDMTVSNSTFYDCKKGIFVHGSADFNITGCYFNTMSNAIINAGLDGYGGQAMVIDHCTLYNIDLMIAGSSSRWWDGYGIFHTNVENITDGTATVTNSIIMQATLAGMAINGWPLTNDYNCWDTGLLGLANIEDGSPGSNSIETDPQFVDAANGDLRLVVGSPCLDAASDGTNMGAYQGPGIAAGISDAGSMSASAAGVSLANPVVGIARFELAEAPTASVRLRVYAPDGTEVASVAVDAGARSVSWTPGAGIEAGTYLYRLGNALGTVVVAK